MDIQIFSKFRLERMSGQIEKKHIVISISDPHKPFTNLLNDNPNRLGDLRLAFSDEEDAFVVLRNKDGDEITLDFSAGIIQPEQAEFIVEFVLKHKDDVDLIICQCDAGISRSAAVAAAISVILKGEGSGQWVFDSNHYVPNRLVYSEVLNAYYNRLHSN